MEGSTAETDGGFAIIGIIMFIETPHLPKKQVTLCVVDRKISPAKLSALQQKHINYIFSWQHSDLLPGIDTHPDMTLCHLGGSHLVAEPQSYSYYQQMLAPYGFQVHKGERMLQRKYPDDIAYNVLLFQNTLFGNLKYVEPAILAFAEQAGYELVNTPQGYTKCASYPVAENAIITGDPGLMKIFEQRGMDVLFLPKNNIQLTGFPEGFIGGTGGKLHHDCAAFFGSVHHHPHWKRIQAFCEKHSVRAENLSNETLQDHGSLLPLLQADF